MTITATSGAHPTKNASATVTITPAGAVSVSPTSASVQVSATQPFSATVTGSNNTGVTWSVNGVAGGNTTTGTISASGLYTAPASVPSPATVTISATSAADPTKSASASVTITRRRIGVRLSDECLGAGVGHTTVQPNGHRVGQYRGDLDGEWSCWWQHDHRDNLGKRSLLRSSQRSFARHSDHHRDQRR